MPIQVQKSFGQFSSLKTQRLSGLDPVKIELDTQEKMDDENYGIDFSGGDVKICLLYTSPSPRD